MSLLSALAEIKAKSSLSTEDKSEKKKKIVKHVMNSNLNKPSKNDGMNISKTIDVSVNQSKKRKGLSDDGVPPGTTSIDNNEQPLSTLKKKKKKAYPLSQIMLTIAPLWIIK